MCGGAAGGERERSPAARRRLGGWHRLRSCIRTYLGCTCARLRLIQARMQECRRDRDPEGGPMYRGEREREWGMESSFWVPARSSGKTFTRLASAAARRVRSMNALRSPLSRLWTRDESPPVITRTPVLLVYRTVGISFTPVALVATGSEGWIDIHARGREEVTSAYARKCACSARTSRCCSHCFSGRCPRREPGSEHALI